MIKKIKVYSKSRNMDLGTAENFGLGITNDNLADILFFEFDEMIEGQASLLTDLVGEDGTSSPIPLFKVENGYQLEITKEMLTQKEITIQLVVSNDELVWHSKDYTLKVLPCLDAGTGPMPSGVELWITEADKHLQKIDEAVEQAKEIKAMADRGEFNGKDGQDGRDGYTPIKGVDYFDGATGPRGLDGKDGVTPNISIGTVTTLDAGQKATVTRTGTDEAPVLNFGIPKGDKGEDGQGGGDLSEYVKKTDYASNTSAGVFKANNGVGVNSSTGAISCSNRSYEQYQSDNNNYFVSKGTLENVIAGKDLINSTNYATSSQAGVIKSNGDLGTFVNNGILQSSNFAYDTYKAKSNNAFVSKGTLENVIAGKDLADKEYVDEAVSHGGGDADLTTKIYEFYGLVFSTQNPGQMQNICDYLNSFIDFNDVIANADMFSPRYYYPKSNAVVMFGIDMAGFFDTKYSYALLESEGAYKIIIKGIANSHRRNSFYDTPNGVTYIPVPEFELMIHFDSSNVENGKLKSVKGYGPFGSYRYELNLENSKAGVLIYNPTNIATTNYVDEAVSHSGGNYNFGEGLIVDKDNNVNLDLLGYDEFDAESNSGNCLMYSTKIETFTEISFLKVNPYYFQKVFLEDMAGGMRIKFKYNGAYNPNYFTIYSVDNYYDIGNIANPCPVMKMTYENGNIMFYASSDNQSWDIYNGIAFNNINMIEGKSYEFYIQTFDETLYIRFNDIDDDSSYDFEIPDCVFSKNNLDENATIIIANDLSKFELSEEPNALFAEFDVREINIYDEDEENIWFFQELYLNQLLRTPVENMIDRKIGNIDNVLSQLTTLDLDEEED